MILDHIVDDCDARTFSNYIRQVDALRQRKRNELDRVNVSKPALTFDPEIWKVMRAMTIEIDWWTYIRNELSLGSLANDHR